MTQEIPNGTPHHPNQKFLQKNKEKALSIRSTAGTYIHNSPLEKTKIEHQDKIVKQKIRATTTKKRCSLPATQGSEKQNKNVFSSKTKTIYSGQICAELCQLYADI